jgi:hypothetical protein
MTKNMELRILLFFVLAPITVPIYAFKLFILLFSWIYSAVEFVLTGEWTDWDDPSYHEGCPF